MAVTLAPPSGAVSRAPRERSGRRNSPLATRRDLGWRAPPTFTRETRKEEMRSPRRVLNDWFVRWITRPRRHYQRFVCNAPERLKATIQPGDVLLVEGDQHVSQAVKYLTQSTWSHSALFIGD